MTVIRGWSCGGIYLEVFEGTEDKVKVKVYEWVWVNYKFSGDSEIQTMGFGTNHIIDFDKGEDKLSLVADSYLEVTGFENGNEKDLAILREKLNDKYYQVNVTENIVNFESIIKNNSSPTLYTSLATTDSYNYSAAVAYADRWCGNPNLGVAPEYRINPDLYNPQFYYYEADCCNFVSQCLYAGGNPMTSSWWAQFYTENGDSSGRLDKTGSKSSLAWCAVLNFDAYWSQSHTKVRVTYDNFESVLGAGNPIYWLSTDGYETNHAMLIVGAQQVETTKYIMVDAHNYDVYHYPIDVNYHIFYTLWF